MLAAKVFTADTETSHICHLQPKLEKQNLKSEVSVGGREGRPVLYSFSSSSCITYFSWVLLSRDYFWDIGWYVWGNGVFLLRFLLFLLLLLCIIGILGT